MAERDRGVYSPPPDDDYDARDSGRRGMILLAVSVVILLAAGAMAWSTYNLGLREGGREGAPRIVADSSPFRSEPADPGGFQAPDQDIEVYDTLTGERRDTVETLAPPPEQPMPEALEAEPDTPEEPASQGVQIVEIDPDELDTAIDERPAEPEPAPIQPEPEPEPAPPPAPAAQVTTGGAWLVQIAALRSEDEANATWRRVSGAHSGLMSQVSLDLQRADLGDRGIYYRVRASSFATKAAAEDFCGALKQEGQDCIVVAR